MNRTFDVMEAVLANNLPDDCTIQGDVHLNDAPSVERLPARLTVNGSLILQNCRNLSALPSGLTVTKKLDVSGCTGLLQLPSDIKVGNELILDGCTSLVTVPIATTDTVSCRGCTALVALGRIEARYLNLSGCTKLKSLRNGIFVQGLNITDCTGLRALPGNMSLASLSLAGSALTGLPESCRGTRLLWHGVTVTREIVFHPELIEVDEILLQSNSALRRIMLERFGIERFINAVKSDVLDTDRDPGGDRRLLRRAIAGDEDLVCLEVRCPSTQAVYILRVPPHLQTCRAAAAWTAGYDDVEAYRPLVET